MRLPTKTTISREDIKGAPAWVTPIVDTFNSFAETVYQALNRNITFSENIASFDKELIYTTPAAYPVMDNVSFVNTLKTKAVGVQLLQALDRSNYTPVLDSVYVPWVEINGSIVISPILGLAASKTYTIRLRVS